MTTKLSEIIASANDFDETVYCKKKIPGYYDHFAATYAQTLPAMLPDDINYEEALKLAVDGYKKYGDSMTALKEWVSRKNIKVENFETKFFRLYHRNLLHTFRKVAPHVFLARSEAADVLELLGNRVPQGIASHGCADEFIRPSLPGMQLDRYFNDNAILGLADSGFQKKSTHTTLVVKCLQKLGVSPEVSMLTEDNLQNIEHNKERIKGLTTAYIHAGQPLESKPSYVDYQFTDYAEYLRALYTAHMGPRKFYLGA